jgi:surface polysaccharide O-acyltransferase-like enzyme
MSERRYYGLDALRGVMMLLGVVLHTAMFYADLPMIPIADRQRSPFLGAVVLLIHSFRMPLFFLLSGFFWALLVEKHGLKRAYSNRVQRILVPFLIGVLTLVPLAGWLTLCFGVSAEAGTWMFWTTSREHLEWARRLLGRLSPEPERLLAPAHLWFLYYLMLFYLLLPICLVVRQVVRRPSWTKPVRRLLASPWLPAVLAVWTAANLLPYPGAFVGLQYVRPQLAGLAYYGTFFVLGYLLHGFSEVLTTCQRHLRIYAAGSALAFLAALGPSILDFRDGSATSSMHLLAACLNGAFVFTTVVAFVSYHSLARRTWISVLLNGRRFSLRWPWLEPAGGAYSVPMAPEGSALRS